VSLTQVTPDAWRETVQQLLAGGRRFAGAWVRNAGESPRWRAAFAGPDGMHVLTCAAPEGRVHSIVDLVPAAAWDEREAHDLYGLGFTGHEPLRALAAHPEDPTAWMTPVVGGGAHQVAVGPIHAGVIESGHFRFHCVGERILALDPRLFYKHRGLERAAEGSGLDEALPYVQRACAACAVTNGVAYAHAVEEALGLRPDRELSLARTLLLELERLYNHLHDIGAICAGVGFAPGAMVFAALKDRAQRVNAIVTGHRFLFGSVSVRSSSLALDARAVTGIREELRDLRREAARAWRELEFSGSLQARLDGIGVLEHEDAVALGATGPPARASGVRHDARTESPRLRYGGFAAAAPRAATGDVAARLELRAVELEATADLLDDLLTGPVAPGVAHAAAEPAGVGIGMVEGPRGTTLCAVELDGKRVARVHLRTGSYANWPALACAAVDNLLPDFPLINKSFELCYACVDR
jgi:Ni,Fe-hydrogenase III large subunit